MKRKEKVVLLHESDIDTAKFKIIIKENNETTYKVIEKLSDVKYNDINIIDTGNGIKIITSSDYTIGLDYSEAVALTAGMLSLMKSQGYYSNIIEEVG